MTKWDEHYQTEEYIFGTEPNEFIAEFSLTCQPREEP